MLGWYISVRRKAARRKRPATVNSPSGPRVAAWQGGLDAIDWLEALIPDGAVIDLHGNGYPRRMTGRADALVPTILAGPPGAHDVWVAGPNDRFVAEPVDSLGTGWLGRTTIDRREAERCSPTEWLLLEVWDES